MNEEDIFHLATNHLKTLLPNLEESTKENDLLYLYARYKQATEGPCNVNKPSFINFTSRKKWMCWNDLKKMSKKIAMREYVKKIKILDPLWDPETQKVKSGMGVSVSVMCHDKQDLINDVDKDIFDWCREGVIDKVKELMPRKPPLDDEKRSLLHWACDRGHRDLVSYFISEGLDVNYQDGDMLTPLHYASSCGHCDITELLLRNNADPSIQDVDGESPIQCASSEEIRNIFKKFINNG